ncbi:MAG: TonB-dependent receptor plug domain-containing protein [Archangium sp.]
MLITVLLLTLAQADGGTELQTVVTGTRSPRSLTDSPVATQVIPLTDIQRSPTVLTDDLLRSASPGTQTFRRSSSITADPTSQGLSLRGIGPSGVSRASLFVDGIPTNDGFGGWVYWRALPRLGIDHIEVVPGAASAQYGSGALGGVIQVITRPINPGFVVDADGFIGTQNTQMGGMRIAGGSERVRASVEIEALRSDGFPITAPAQRGPIDLNAPNSHLSTNARIEANLVGSLTGFISGGYFTEEQNAGTPLSGSKVRQGHAEMGFDWEAGGHWQARLYGRLERFNQTRSRVAADRSSEVLTATQNIPINDEGLSLVWSSNVLQAAGEHRVSAGVDGRVTGALARDQQLGGVFIQDAWKFLPWLEAVGAIRADGWKNGDRTAGALSPKLALHAKVHPTTSLRAAVYRAFRAPTLNELYRPFQVGTILTEANDALAPETINGGDLGVETSIVPGLTMRATGFANWLQDPIVNVTLESGNRQRQNQGAARIIGLEAGADWRFLHDFTVSAAYTLVDARVIAGDAELIGKQLPQDPAHRFTGTVMYSNPRFFTAMLQVRVLSQMYEDDRNTLAIPAVALVDASISRLIGPGLEVFAAAQNLGNETYLVGRAGVDTVGPPFSFRAGLKLRSQAW